jgi:two-component system sensor kinase FixL
VSQSSKSNPGAGEEPPAGTEQREPADNEPPASELKFRELADTLPQTVFEVDASGKISYVNKNALTMFGYTPQDVEDGINALAIIDPADHDRITGAILKMMDGRSTGAVREYLARRKDGTTFPCIVYSALVQDAEGNPAGIRGILTDTSEQKEMERALRDEQEFTENIINSLSDIFYVLSVEKGGLLIRWNRAFNMVSGYSDAELASMTVFDFFEARDQQEQEQFLARLVEEGSASMEGDAIMKDGNTRPYHFSSTLVRDDEDTPRYVTGVGRDMSELKNATEALRETTEYLENLFDYANAPIIVWDRASRITRFNRAFERLTGYASSEVIGAGLAILFPAESQEESLGKIDDTLTGEYWESVEIPILTKDGKMRIVLWNSANVYGVDGNTVTATIAQGQDISERKQAEDALRESEDRYRQIFEHATEGIFQSTMEGTLRNINPAFARMYGYDSTEQMKEVVTDIAAQVYYDPADREEIKRLLVQEGIILGMDVRFKRRDGSPLWVNLDAHLVRDEEGNIVCLEGTTTDVSVRKKAEERLRLSQFEVDRAMDQIVRVDKDGRVVYANEAAAASYGYTHDEMPALSIWDISLNFPEEGWTELFEATRQMETMRIVTAAVHREGHTFPLEANINHTLFEGSEYLVIFGRDITERRLGEQRQEELNDELVATNKELNDFAYVVSHDLKAPLRGISSLATWLSADYADKLGDEGRMQLSLLLNRAQRMERLIESILQYSRLGRLSESKELVDLNELAAGAIDLLSVPEGVTVSVDGELPTVMCERTRMGQVFANLMGNAVKYIDRPDGKVTVSSESDGDFWRIAVADNGPGIDEQYREKIFQIFQSLAPDENTDSTGVGLTLVKKIVELHGGKVWVDSQPGAGATFYFTIPKEYDAGRS